MPLYDGDAQDSCPQRENRSNGEINSANDQNKGHADGNKDGGRNLVSDRLECGCGKEMRSLKTEKRNEQNQDDH